MNQVKEKPRFAKVFEVIAMLFRGLGGSDIIIQDPEEEIKKSGYKELINSQERLDKMAEMFTDRQTSVKEIRQKNNETKERPEIRQIPRIKSSTFNITKKQDENSTISSKEKADDELQL